MSTYRRELKMQQAVQKLTKYFGLLTTQDLANVIAAGTRSGGLGSLSTDANSLTTQNSNGNSFTNLGSVTDEDRILGEIITAFLDQSLGCYTTQELLQLLAGRMQIEGDGTSEPTGEDAELINILRQRYSTLFHIVSDAQYAHAMPYPPGYERMKNGSIKNLLNDGEPGLLASAGASPTKGKPGLSAIISNTGRISTANRYVNSACVFLNAIPAIEMSKAIPYLEVNVLLPAQAVQRSGDRLVAPTIYKFLLGGVQAEAGTTLRDISLANEEVRATADTATASSTGASAPDRMIYTNMGIEAFTMPQTLVNPNASSNSGNFGSPVLDKFRPFLSVKEFSVEGRLIYSAYMYHTAKMSLTLHDRSRLNEIAEFVKPEIRGLTEIVVEFGWCHTEAEYDTNSDNVWAAIINGMRKRQKYNVVNSSFSFDDSGQVEIQLELATSGESATTVEPVTNDINVRPILEEINNAVDLISRLRLNIPALNPSATASSQTSGPGAGPARPSTSTEIRGIQFLNSTQDVFSNLTLSRDQREEFRNLMRSLSALPQADDIRRMRTLLTQLYGDSSTRTRGQGPNRTGEGSLTDRLRSQIRNEIRAKVENLKKGLEDPFLVGTYNPVVDRRLRERNAGGRPSRNTQTNQQQISESVPRTSESTRAQTDSTSSTYASRLETFNTRLAATSPVPRGAVSLANLLMVFMGQPLAATNQFDDIQFVFYPFNRYAAFASRINIANFIINIEDFIDKYTEYRLQNVTRNGVFTIRQFWTFLTSQIIDDPGQDSYGLVDGRGALYRRPTIDRDSDESGSSSRSTISQPVESDGARFTTRLNNLLSNITPDGSFRLPMLQYELECLPGRSSNQTDIEDRAIEKSILRVHIYDQQYTPYDGLGSILQAQRNARVSITNNPNSTSTPDGSSTDTSLVELNANRYNQEILNRAVQNGIVARTVDESGNSVYEVIGGAESLKRFLYETTPYIIYGAQNSLVKNANLSSMTDQAAATIAMVNGPTGNGLLRPDGQDAGNIPMQILPVELTIDTYGCPLIYSATQFFIDFGTNTTADDIYAVTGIEHKISSGDFSTSLKFRALSSYGQYRNYIQDLRNAEAQLREYEERLTGQPAQDVNTRRSHTRPRRTSRSQAPDTTTAISGSIPGNPAVPDAPRVDTPNPDAQLAAYRAQIERQEAEIRSEAQRRQTEAERLVAAAAATTTGRLPASSGTTTPAAPSGLTPPTPTTPATTAGDRRPFTTSRGQSLRE